MKIERIWSLDFDQYCLLPFLFWISNLVIPHFQDLLKNCHFVLVYIFIINLKHSSVKEFIFYVSTASQGLPIRIKNLHLFNCVQGEFWDSSLILSFPKFIVFESILPRQTKQNKKICCSYYVFDQICTLA